MAMNPKLPELPEAMLLEVFSRLPSKSVGQCRLLSKLWRTNLSSTNFIKKHLTTRSQTLWQAHVALLTSVDELHIVTSPLKNDEKLTKWTGVPEKFSIVYGGYNGLLLIRPMGDDVRENVMLMNPITRQKVNIPDPTLVWYGEYSMVYGFGYDGCNDDYKVIILNSSDPYDPYEIDYEEDEIYDEEGDEINAEEVEEDEEEANSTEREQVTLIDVYSVKTGVWKRLNRYPFGELLPSLSVCRNGAFVNGAVHWLICARNSGYYCHIAAFDVVKEIFHEMPFPAEFNRNRPDGVVSLHDFSGIFEIGGCLSIVYNLSKVVGDDYGNSSNEGTDIWVMMEYGVGESWVRFHIAGHEYGKSLVPICLVGDEMKIMCYTERDDLVVCDLKDGTTKKVIVGGKDTWYWCGMPFVDSLISPV